MPSPPEGRRRAAAPSDRRGAAPGDGRQVAPGDPGLAAPGAAAPADSRAPGEPDRRDAGQPDRRGPAPEADPALATADRRGPAPIAPAPPRAPAPPVVPAASLEPDPWIDPWAAPERPGTPAAGSDVLKRRSRRARTAEAAAARLRALTAGPALRAEAEAAAPGSAEPPQEAGLLGPVQPLIEGFALLALVLLLGVPLSGGTFYAGWPVHPFALPVLYVAARHGLLPGAATAAAAALLRLALALVTDTWSAGAWVEPLAWPMAAVLVGTFADRARSRAASAEQRAIAAEAERTAIADSNERLAARAVELEQRLAARLQAATALFESARALGHGSEGVVRGATGLVRAATGCTACSFWLAEGNALHLVAAEGWPAGATLNQSTLRGALPAAMEQGGSLLATRPADRLTLGEEGILAAPVRSPWDGALLGMVKVEDIGFSELALDTLSALEAACGWLGAALAEARAREEAGAAGPGAASTASGILAGEEASRAIAAMTGLARRVGFDLALLSAEIPAGPRAAAALEATRAAMGETFRGSDLLLEARLDERRLSVLLPGAAVQGADIAATRLRGLLQDRAPGATAPVVVSIAALHRVTPRHG
jgi:hypothetical protein